MAELLSQHFSSFSVFIAKQLCNFEMDQMCQQKNVVKLFLKSITAVNPSKLLSENLKIENGNLQICHKVYDLAEKNIYLVGFGKAVLGMAVQAEKILGQFLKSGVICCPVNTQKTFGENPEFTLKKNSVLKVFEGAKNNLPDEDAVKGTDEILSLVKKLNAANDHLIVLISGGGSALLTKPRLGISLKEKLEIVKVMMKSGADINELNTVRKKLSLVKGGGLACASYPVKTTSLILSDVINDPIDIIASGPTVPSVNSNLTALDVIQKYYLEKYISENVLKEINDKFNYNNIIHNNEFSHVDNFIIGNNTKALAACKNYAQELGYETIILSNEIKGDVEIVSDSYINLIYELLSGILNKNSEISKNALLLKVCFDIDDTMLTNINKILCALKAQKNICILAGGETTVKIKGKGLGGRNQELALLTSLKIEELKLKYPYLFTKYNIMFLFGGTDGIDGPTDAAGAIGGSFVVEKAKKYNLDLNEYLSRNDSYTFFSKIDNGAYLIKTGHTGTNVMDIHIILMYPKTL